MVLEQIRNIWPPAEIAPGTVWKTAKLLAGAGAESRVQKLD